MSYQHSLGLQQDILKVLGLALATAPDPSDFSGSKRLDLAETEHLHHFLGLLEGRNSLRKYRPEKHQ